MDKRAFLKKIISLYDDFSEKNQQARIEAYNIVLTGNIDYSKLYERLMQTYTSLSFAPSPAILFQLVEKARQEDEMAEFIAKNQLERQKQEEKAEKIEKIEISEEEKAKILEIQKQLLKFKFRGADE